MDGEEKHINSKYLYGYILAIACGAFQFGYGFACFNPVMSMISAIYGWDKSTEKWLTGILSTLITVGALFGAFLAGFIISKGRIKGIFVSNGLIVLGSALNLIQSVPCLAIGRTIQGFGIGISATLVPLYIREVAPKKISGFLGSFNQISNTFAIIFPMILGAGIGSISKEDLASSQIWRGIFLFPLLISTIQVTLFLSIYFFDSPKFYVAKGENTKAKRALICIYSKPEYAESVLTQVQSAYNEEQNSGGVTLKELIGPIYRWPLILGILTSFFQQFSGINVVIFYSSNIFSDDGKRNPSVPNTLFTIINFGCTILASLIVDKFGRKILLVGGSLAIALCMITIGSLYHTDDYFVKILFFELFIGFFALSHGPVCWIYTSEILPPIGVSISIASNFLFTILIVLFTPLLLDSLKGFYFEFFGIVMIFATLFSFFMMPETKGLSEAEIKQLFDSNNTERITNILEPPEVKEEDKSDKILL